MRLETCLVFLVLVSSLVTDEANGNQSPAGTPQVSPASREGAVMTTITPAIKEFFDRYARSRSVQDIDLIASQYPDSFMIAGPNGVQVAQKSAVLATFPKGQEFLKSLGHESTEVLSLNETRIDEHYLLVRALFVWRFRREPMPSREAKVDSTFVLYIDKGALKIVFQHEHEDFQQVLRASGVLPAQPIASASS
jgi:hypothetical protein